MTTSMHATEHSHGEQWTMRAGLDPEHVRFAGLVRPVISTLKTYLVAVGGAALVDTDAGRPARDLRNWVSQTHRRLVDLSWSGAIEPLVAEMTDGLREIEAWAQSIEAAAGVSGAAAAGLSDAYRRIRAAAGTVWHSEMVPEGRTHRMEASVG